MLTRNDLKILYEWAKNTKFPCKKAPTIDGYSNKVIDYYWLKSVKKSTIIRQKYMSDEVYEIYKNENILFSNSATIGLITSDKSLSSFPDSLPKR